MHLMAGDRGEGGVRIALHGEWSQHNLLLGDFRHTCTWAQRVSPAAMSRIRTAHLAMCDLAALIIQLLLTWVFFTVML